MQYEAVQLAVARIYKDEQTKQLLDEAFVVSWIIKVEVGVMTLSVLDMIIV